MSYAVGVSNAKSGRMTRYVDPVIGRSTPIQGLRALAVVSVIVFHLNPVWLPGGFLGVDIFFVIICLVLGSFVY